MDYVPKEIVEEVNVTSVHPLQYFGKVVVMLAAWGVGLYFLTGAIADQLAKVVAPSFEASIGQSLSAPLTEDEVRPDQEKTLQAILNELQAQGRLPKAEIHVIESDTVNAGTLPGGQIVITTALLDQAQSENELAFVLAHELAHHELRHPIRGLGRSLLWLLILSVLGIGQQVPGGLQQAEPVTRTLADLQFSRKQEVAADRFALKMIQARYGHIDHALDFFQRLDQQHLDPVNESLNLEFFQTHPFPKNRIATLQQYARDRQWSLIGPKTELSF